MIITPHYSSSAGNLYEIGIGGRSFLIECGVPISKIRERLTLSKVAFCLVSHAHADHSKSAAELLRAGVECIMSPETADVLAVSGPFLAMIKPGDYLRRDGVAIYAWQAIHDCPGALGFFIQTVGGNRLLYACDTGYIHNRFAGITHLMIECNFSRGTLNPSLQPIVKNRLWINHLSLETVVDFLAANDLSQLQEVWLLHLSDGNSDENLFRETVQKSVGCRVIVAGK